MVLSGGAGSPVTSAMRFTTPPSYTFDLPKNIDRCPKKDDFTDFYCLY
jgi:hypothetical protein